jgi:hypothetical protein
MSYRWPLPHPDKALHEALDIALDYLEATGQAKAGDDTWQFVSDSILSAWQKGARHKIRLANTGILAVEQARARKETGLLCLDALRDLTLP